MRSPDEPQHTRIPSGNIKRYFTPPPSMSRIFFDFCGIAKEQLLSACQKPFLSLYLCQNNHKLERRKGNPAPFFYSSLFKLAKILLFNWIYVLPKNFIESLEGAG
jgi:hypothetical protein